MENLVDYFFIFQRAGLRAVILVLAIIAMVYFFIKRPKEEDEGEESVVTSRDLLNNINEDRQKKGLHEIPEVNSKSGGNTYARLDKSFKSVPDFFVKLFSKKRD